MIDLQTEHLMTIPQAAVRLGKSPATLKRWVLQNILEGIQLPGGLHTTAEAIERMVNRLSQVRGLGRPTPQSPAARTKADKEAVEFLRSRGIAI